MAQFPLTDHRKSVPGRLVRRLREVAAAANSGIRTTHVLSRDRFYAGGFFTGFRSEQDTSEQY